MKNNNGKIAIAIVAMFVVALSVVGFTYAYFTATVKNNGADSSVEVTAGSMIVTYSGGNGETFTAKNILPGWSNDGDKYFDTVASVTYKDGQNRYSAASLATVTKANAKPFGAEIAAGQTATDDQLKAAGLTAPVTFSVKNDGDNTAVYDLWVKVLSNNIKTTDITFVYYTATTATTSEVDGKTVVVPQYGAASEPITLGDTDALHQIGEEVNVPKNGIVYYKIVYTYKDTGVKQDDDQPESTNEKDAIGFSTTMVIEGLDQSKVTQPVQP